MADIAITAANVQAGANAVVDRQHNAGAAIVAGQEVYLDPTTRHWLLADSNAAAAAAHESHGVALNTAANGQPLAVQTDGDITLGAVLTSGVAYYLSATPGAICPAADVVTGDAVCLIGLARSPSVLALDIQFPGVTN